MIKFLRFLFSEHMLNLSCATGFICLKNIVAKVFCFVIKCPYARKFMVLKIRKAFDFHSLYQLLLSQEYRNGLEREFLTLKFVLINKGKSNRNSLKMFACKKLMNDTKKALRAGLIKRLPDVSKIDACAAAKYKIIFHDLTQIFATKYFVLNSNKREISNKMCNLRFVFP